MLLTHCLSAALALVATISPVMAAAPCPFANGGSGSKGMSHGDQRLRKVANPSGWRKWRHRRPKSSSRGSAGGHSHQQSSKPATTRQNNASTRNNSSKKGASSGNNKSSTRKNQTNESPSSSKGSSGGSSGGSTGGSGGSSSSGGDAATNGLKVHNDFRAKYGAAPLTWNQKIADGAAQYAATCAMGHSGVSGLGENLSWGPGDINGGIQLWLNEAKDYDYNNPGFSGATGHFTQVVWKGTKEVGCGFAKCGGQYGTMIVCRYSPPGNYIGADNFRANVGRPV